MKNLKCEGNEKVFDTYFNGYCFWSEEVSYHYLSGCKVYFTCQRGKFLKFHRCPESTIFNTETHQCEPNGICKVHENINPTFDAWWEKAVSVMGEVLEALDNISARNQNKVASTSAAEISQKNPPASPTVLPSSTIPSKTLLQTKYPLMGGPISSDRDTVNNPNVKESVSLLTITESTSDGISEFDLNPVKEIPISYTKPTHSVTNLPETKHLSVSFIPLQFDTQTSILTERLSSSSTPLQGDGSKTIDQLSFPLLGSITSLKSTNEPNIIKDFIIPIAEDVLKNSTIMSKVNLLFKVFFETADPLVYQILDQQVDEEIGSTIRISLKDFKDAWNRTTFLTTPILLEVIFRDLFPIISRKITEKAAILNDIIDRGDLRILGKIPSILWTLFNLIFKYRLLAPSESDHLKTVSLLEIRKDFKEVFDILSNASIGQSH